jgi:hypothetical protein
MMQTARMEAAFAIDLADLVSFLYPPGVWPELLETIFSQADNPRFILMALRDMDGTT